MAQEGPISLSLAARRVAAAWGFERVHGRALARVRSLIPADRVRIQDSGTESFLWSADVDPEHYPSFRVPGPDAGSARAAEDLPLEEISNAILHLLESHGSAPEEELLRETARLCGFQRTGRVVEERIRRAIDGLKRRGIVRDSAGKTLRIS